MIAPVYTTLSSASGVTAIVSDRIYRTQAKQDTARPYIVWSVVSATPENTLADRPEIDESRIQVDCYSESQSQARALSDAAQYAIEGVANVVMGPLEFYEPDTMLYRFTFDAVFFTAR